jgi:hypothetical protein
MYLVTYVFEWDYLHAIPVWVVVSGTGRETKRVFDSTVSSEG